MADAVLYLFCLRALRQSQMCGAGTLTGNAGCTTLVGSKGAQAELGTRNERDSRQRDLASE